MNSKESDSLLYYKQNINNLINIIMLHSFRNKGAIASIIITGNNLALFLSELHDPGEEQDRK